MRKTNNFSPFDIMESLSDFVDGYSGNNRYISDENGKDLSYINSMRDNFGRIIDPNRIGIIGEQYAYPENPKYFIKKPYSEYISPKKTHVHYVINDAKDIPKEYYGKKVLFFVETKESEYKFVYDYVNVINGSPSLSIIGKYNKIVLPTDISGIESLINSMR